MDPHSLPFEVGQLVETRSLLPGYRGAWFKCKIKEIGYKNGTFGHAVEYIDFPDEKITWLKLYQKHAGRSRNKIQTLMVRPKFPSVYRESQMHDVNTISETVVISNDFWKVGDLVDWWTDGCFWTGTIIEILNDEKVKIELLAPPEGEGEIYKASCKDLRPSLDWSEDEGWTLPKVVKSTVGDLPSGWITEVEITRNANGVRKDKEKLGRRCCARIVKPLTQGGSGSLKREIVCPDIVDHIPKKRNCSDDVSFEHVQGTQTQMSRMVECDDVELKKIKTNESVCLNSTYSDMIEAAILDLEELIWRVKWLKRILNVETPLSNALTSSWKFIEHRASSMPK